jgi:hypothetical protein
MLKKTIWVASAVFVMPLSVLAEGSTLPSSISGATSPETVVRSTDEIILLPKMVVREPNAPVFNEREIYTQRGMDELLRKRFPGAAFKGQPRQVDNYAMLMYEDEKRYDALTRYQGLADLLKASGDAAGSKELRTELNRTFIRSHDWKMERMDRSANGGRR